MKKNFKLISFDLFLLIIVIILIMTYSMLKIYTYKSEPILMDYAKNKSINIINYLINNSINEFLNDKNFKIIETEKNKDGDIVNINIDTNKVNKVLYLLTNDIYKNIKKLENSEYDSFNHTYISKKDSILYLPIGIIHDMPLMSNIGPKIPFKIEMIGSVNSKAFNNVKDYGINSSLIESLLNIELQLQVILPFKSETISIEKNILLDTKIIQGNIPEYYGGIISSSLKK